MNTRFVVFVVTYFSLGIILNSVYLILLPVVWIVDDQRKMFVRLFYLYHRIVSTLFWQTAVSGYPIDRIRKPCVFVMNHQTILDSFPIYLMSPHICKLIITSRFKWIPVVGSIAMFLKMVFVNPSCPRNNQSVLTQSVRCLSNGISLILAPEGKLSYAKELNPFKLGAFQIACAAGVPVVPVRNETRLLFEPGKPLKLRSGSLKIHLFDPIESNPYSPEELRQRTFQQINSLSLE